MASELMLQLLENTVNFLVYAAIVVLFIVCLIKCVAPVLNTRNVLKSAARSIRAGENSKRSWQEETFLGKGALLPHWKEYLNNLFFADGEFHNPSNIEDYINEDTAIYGPGRASLSEAAPGIMVSLGFLGTLIGITTGLQGFSMENSDAVMTAIRTLVPGMRYAFMTSIVGVIFSIIFTILIRFSEGSALRALSGFYSAMRENAGVVSVDPMTQIAIYQQEQTALIQTLTEDVTGTMTNRIGTAIDKAVKPMQKSLEEFVTMTTREQLRGIDTMVTRFIQQLDTTLDNQLQHLAYTIDQTCRNQQQMQGDIGRTVDGISQVARDTMQVQKITDSLLTQFESYLGKLNASQRMADDGYQRIAANVEHLEIIARQQNAYLQTVGELQSEANKSYEKFTSTADEFMERFEDNISVTAGSLTKVCEEMKQAGDVLAANQKLLVNGVNKDIDKTYNDFFARMEQSSAQIGRVMDDIRGGIDKLADLLDGTAGLYAGQSDRMTDALRRAQAALEDAVDRLSALSYGR